MATQIVVDKTDNNGDQDDVISIDLPAPQFWIKKFILKNSGTPRRNEIVFIAPSGEEIKSKRQLDQYLKSHPGGPSASEFDWGTGDTPRRSTRLSSKPKARKTPESIPWTKRQKRSSLKKKDVVKDETNGEGDSAEDEEPIKKTESSKDVEMKDAEVGVNHSEQEKANETAVDAKDVAMKDTEVAIDCSEEEKTNETVLYTISAKAPVEKVEENIDEANKHDENMMESGKEGNNVAEECVPDQEEAEHEVTKSGTDVEQAEVQVPQETVPNLSKECPDENEPKEDTLHFDAELPKVKNVAEEKPEEGKHDANNTVEEQRGEITEVGEITETPNDTMEEQPRETEVASGNEIEEQVGATKEAPKIAIEEAGATNVLEECVPGKEEEHEEKMSGKDEEAEVQVPQETVPNISKEYPDENEPKEDILHFYAELPEVKNVAEEKPGEVQVTQETVPQEDNVHFDAELSEVNNVPEEKPGEEKHAANNETNNAEEQPRENTEVPNPNNAVEEKAGEITETPNTALGETKEALENAIKEQHGATKEPLNSAIEEQPDISTSRSFVDKSVNEAVLPNSSNEIEGSN